MDSKIKKTSLDEDIEFLKKENAPDAFRVILDIPRMIENAQAHLATASIKEYFTSMSGILNHITTNLPASTVKEILILFATVKNLCLTLEQDMGVFENGKQKTLV